MNQTKQAKYEEAVVHILLSRPTALAGHEIDEKWFTKWRPVIAAAKAIAAAGNEPDMVTLADHIKRPGLLQELNQILRNSHAAAENLPKYLAGLRSIYQAVHVQQTLSSALAELQGGADLDEVLARMMQSTLSAVATESRNYNHTIKQALGQFVDELEAQDIKAHVARKKTGSAVDGRTARGKGYAQSLKRRKIVEEAFGWVKTVGGLRKTRHIGLAKVAGQALFCFAAYNLTRLLNLLVFTPKPAWSAPT
ncbi:hypothetical protein AYM39_04235 [Methylomonas sp. DH-1]|nr:hypothetical protein AYM39_04235 [Methylomonas sp. DH-1]